MKLLFIYDIISNKSMYIKYNIYCKGVCIMKFKDKLSKQFIKWRYSNATEAEFAKIGVKIGFGLMCVIAAVVFFLNW